MCLTETRDAPILHLEDNTYSICIPCLSTPCQARQIVKK